MPRAFPARLAILGSLLIPLLLATCQDTSGPGYLSHEWNGYGTGWLIHFTVERATIVAVTIEPDPTVPPTISNWKCSTSRIITTQPAPIVRDTFQVQVSTGTTSGRLDGYFINGNVAGGIIATGHLTVTGPGCVTFPLPWSTYGY